MRSLEYYSDCKLVLHDMSKRQFKNFLRKSINKDNLFELSGYFCRILSANNKMIFVYRDKSNIYEDSTKPILSIKHGNISFSMRRFKGFMRGISL